jgi:sterol desaturase/sphingolipid hydroxylase (fatty acid hydroxylase superfamily)
MREALIAIPVSFMVLLVVFRLLELTRPRDKRLPVLRAGFWTDAAYWVFTALATRHITRIVVILSLVPLALAIYGRVDGGLIQNGYGPLSRLPLWLQAVLILVIGDFIGYWMHRLFHTGRLWRFHAVHHSSTALDWLASVRVHPLNDAIMRVAGVLPLVALGFAPIAVAGIVPLLTVFAILLHANVDWDWGPLRAVIASPRFHRWHHTSEAEGRDKNFSGLLPLWDILFGTYYMPRDRAPAVFGTDTPVPTGLWRQLAFPFRRTT